LLDQPESMGHDTLIGLPALAGDELKQVAALLAAAKKQVEKLINKGIVGEQRVAGKDDAGDSLKEAALEMRSDSLNDEAAYPGGVTGRQLECQDAAKGNTHERRCFQAMPVEKLRQVFDQIGNSERPSQREAIVFAPKLIADDAKMIGKETGQRPKKLEASREPWNDHQGRALSPFAVVNRVMFEVGTPAFADARTKLGSGGRQPGT
jgi:hypothetical protein